MRIATMIISLILMLVVGAQSCAVSLGDAALQTKAAEQGGPIGLFMAFLFLIGGPSRSPCRSSPCSPSSLQASSGSLGEQAPPLAT